MIDSPFATKPTLRGDRVVLRPPTADDAPALLELLCDPEICRLTGTRHTVEPTVDSLAEWYTTRADHDDRLDLAIVEKVGGAYVGEAVLNEFRAADEACNFRIMVGGPGAYGNGYGTEATRLILAYAIEQAGLHRVDLEVYAFNPRARHVYEKVGFVYEGTKRDALRWDGQWVDAHVMSILADEWTKHRGRPAL